MERVEIGDIREIEGKLYILRQEITPGDCSGCAFWDDVLEEHKKKNNNCCCEIGTKYDDADGGCPGIWEQVSFPISGTNFINSDENETLDSQRVHTAKRIKALAEAIIRTDENAKPEWIEELNTIVLDL